MGARRLNSDRQLPRSLYVRLPGACEPSAHDAIQITVNDEEPGLEMVMRAGSGRGDTWLCPIDSGLAAQDVDGEREDMFKR